MSDPFGPYALAGFRDGLSPFTPGGYGTLLTDGGTIPVSDQASKTACYYAQDAHNAFPIIKNGTRHAVYFDLPRLVLSSAHVAGGIYDVFGVERNGKGHLVTGPVWSTLTAGSGARGTGGGTTELTRAGGAYVNRWGIPGLNGDGSQFIAPGEGCYLFSIYVDSGAAGQVTCHTAWGQSRKWGVWNAYNRKRLHLKAGDATATWPYQANTVRASNNASANSLAVFQGLPEEFYNLAFTQRVQARDLDTGQRSAAQTGIGWNSILAASGRSGFAGTQPAAAGDPDNDVIGSPFAQFLQVPSIGVSVVTSLEAAADANADSITWYGSEAHMVLSAEWRG